MRLSKALIDMEMADYSAALDPAYTTLEFENMQVLAMSNGKSPLSSPLCCGGMSWGLQEEKSLGWQGKCSRGGQECQELPAVHWGVKQRGEQSWVWYRWAGVLQPRALGNRHMPGAGWNERSPPDIQPRE